MKRLIVISGKQLSGKDTFADILLKKLPNFKRIGIGDAIKIEYASKKGITFDEIEKNKHVYRADLIALGNWGRDINPDYWLNKISDMDYIIVPDIRVEHEAEFFREKSAFLIRVNSSLENRLKRGKLVEIEDNTEVALDNYKFWSAIVQNDFDLEYLEKEADRIIKML